jgi:hypothetical protein
MKCPGSPPLAGTPSAKSLPIRRQLALGLIDQAGVFSQTRKSHGGRFLKSAQSKSIWRGEFVIFCYMLEQEQESR